MGLVPDFGIFQHSPIQISIDYEKRHIKPPEIIDWILENRFSYTFDELFDLMNEKFPGNGLGYGVVEHFGLHESSADPKDLADIIPYIVSFHGKFYQMTEIEGQPGLYEDKTSIPRSPSGFSERTDLTATSIPSMRGSGASRIRELPICPMKWRRCAVTMRRIMAVDHAVDVIHNIFARAEDILDVLKVVTENSLKNVLFIRKNILQ